MALSPEQYRQRKRIVYNKTGGCCSYCGIELSINNFHLDHVIPKRRGASACQFHTDVKKERGSDDIDNLMPACGSCNSSKSDLELEDFRYRVKDRLKRLNDYSTEYRIAKRFGLVQEIEKDVVFYFETYKPSPFNG